MTNSVKILLERVEYLIGLAEKSLGTKYSTEDSFFRHYRGNSGIFLMGHYEVQVLDNYNDINKTYVNGQAASTYKQNPPLVNACKAPGEWQTYDIVFTAPRFSEKGYVIEPARITVIHNGVLVQNNTTIWGTTFYIGSPFYEKHDSKEPLILQDHGNTTSFRNIWIREL